MTLTPPVKGTPEWEAMLQRIKLIFGAIAAVGTVLLAIFGMVWWAGTAYDGLQNTLGDIRKELTLHWSEIHNTNENVGNLSKRLDTLTNMLEARTERFAEIQSALSRLEHRPKDDPESPIRPRE